jgi:dihydrofolate reductase
MGNLTYSMNQSLDGYIEDAGGSFDWSVPPADVFRYWIDQTRSAAGFLFGRRNYEIMEEYWPVIDPETVPEAEAEFARAYVDTPRVVFSDTLDNVADGARLVRSADAIAEVTRLKAETDGRLNVGGAALAASLIDLIDEFTLLVSPVVVGGGKPFFPLGGRLTLELAETRTFSEGVVLLRYVRPR